VKSGGVANAVAEMMARSGGFNVPADYFKQPNVIVPATPPTPQKKWGRTVWIAGTVAAVGLVGVIFAIGRPSNGTTTKDAPGAGQVVTVVTVVASTPAPPVPKKMTPVAVVATPDNAEVFKDGALVHQVPCSIEVEEGQTVTIEIRAEHYETQTLKLDGADPSKVVKLVPVKGYRPPTGKGGKGPGAGGPPQTKGGGGKSGGTDVRDPWGNK
jgi:serine/threonine-protein kinase